MKMKKVKRGLLSIYVSLCSIAATTIPVFAGEGGEDVGVSLESILTLISRFVSIGGGIWLVYGLIVLGTGLKDHNGPGIQSGIWQIVGGALILAGGVLFKSISTS